MPPYFDWFPVLILCALVFLAGCAVGYGVWFLLTPHCEVSPLFSVVF